MIDPEVVDKLVRKYRKSPNFDFFTNGFPLTFPVGMDCDILPVSTLEKLDGILKNIKDRENFIMYIMERPKNFRIYRMVNKQNLSKIRLTLDYSEDYRLINSVYLALYPKKKIFLMSDIVRLFRRRPKLLKINKKRVDPLELRRK